MLSGRANEPVRNQEHHRRRDLLSRRHALVQRNPRDNRGQLGAGVGETEVGGYSWCPLSLGVSFHHELAGPLLESATSIPGSAGPKKRPRPVPSVGRTTTAVCSLELCSHEISKIQRILSQQVEQFNRATLYGAVSDFPVQTCTPSGTKIYRMAMMGRGPESREARRAPAASVRAGLRKAARARTSFGFLNASASNC